MDKQQNNNRALNMSIMFSQYDLKTTDVSYLNDKQIAFLRDNEKTFWANVTSSNNKMVSNGDELICIYTHYPILNDIIDYRGDINLCSDITAMVIAPAKCGNSTFATESGTQEQQTTVNRVKHDSHCVYMTANTDQTTIDMVVSILSARWSYLYNQNLKKVTDLMAAYTEINTPKIVSFMPKNKEPEIKVDGLKNKQGAELLAFYLCMDFTDFSDYEYHRHYWTQKVYCINDVYYCPHKTRPSYRYEDGVFERKNWVKVTDIPFPYSNNTIWRYEPDLNE